MLTTVILDGPMGKRFGKKWELYTKSPSEALRLIEANTPGLKQWIRENLETYSSYKVSCVYPDGRKEHLDEQTLGAHCCAKVIRFTPVVEGSGKEARFVIGAALMVAALATGQPGVAMTAGKTFMFNVGASMFLGSVIAMNTQMPSGGDNKEVSRLSSHYFSGPANTSQQGNPVQLIYGRVLVGSQVVSAQMDVDEIKTLEKVVPPTGSGSSTGG